MSWGYYKREYGSRADALEEHYGELLRKNAQLRLAVDNIRLYERAIDVIMAEVDDGD